MSTRLARPRRAVRGAVGGASMRSLHAPLSPMWTPTHPGPAVLYCPSGTVAGLPQKGGVAANTERRADTQKERAPCSVRPRLAPRPPASGNRPSRPASPFGGTPVVSLAVPEGPTSMLTWPPAGGGAWPALCAPRAGTERRGRERMGTELRSPCTSTCARIEPERPGRQPVTIRRRSPI